MQTTENASHFTEIQGHQVHNATQRNMPARQRILILGFVDYAIKSHNKTAQIWQQFFSPAATTKSPTPGSVNVKHDKTTTVKLIQDQQRRSNFIKQASQSQQEQNSCRIEQHCTNLIAKLSRKTHILAKVRTKKKCSYLSDRYLLQSLRSPVRKEI